MNRKNISLVSSILLFLGLSFFLNKTSLWMLKWNKFRNAHIVPVNEILEFKQVGVVRSKGIRKRVRIEYTYDIEGKSYTSDRVSIAGNSPPSFTDPKIIEKIKNFNNDEGELSCYVSMVNANEAVLDRGLSKVLLSIYLLSIATVSFIFYKSIEAYNYEKIRN